MVGSGRMAGLRRRRPTEGRCRAPARRAPWETYKAFSAQYRDGMPYVPPSTVLGRLSEFTADTVVDAIGEESTFVRAQVGSMSSTLGFLAREVEHRDESILERRRALLDALDELEGVGGAAADAFVADQRERVEAVEPVIGNADDVETAVRETLGELQRAVDDGTFGAETPEARARLYELFEHRVESQLHVLGRTE